MLQIAVITSIPTPYRDPFWDVLSRHPDIALDVFYCASGKSDRPWEANWRSPMSRHVMPGINLAKYCGADASVYCNPGVLKCLSRGRYDGVIVGGYNHLTMLAAIAWCRIRKIPYFMMSEVYLAQPRSRWRKIVKALPVRAIFRGASGFFPAGTLARSYVEHYGGDGSRVCTVPNLPDVEAIDQLTREMAGRSSDIRRQLGFGEEPIILFVGRLISLKRVDLLLEAFSRADIAADARLVILGDGPKRAESERDAVRLGIGSRTQFEGFVQPEELTKWYAIANLFVLPSTDETWSVVVLEALAAGVPVVVTDRVGCYADVVCGEGVGTVVPAGNVDELRRGMERQMELGSSADDVREAWAGVRREMSYGVVARRVAGALRRWCGSGVGEGRIRAKRGGEVNAAK